MPEYKIIGFDAHGNQIEETIRVLIEPGWKRVLRRIGRWFGYGRFKRISGINVDQR